MHTNPEAVFYDRLFTVTAWSFGVVGFTLPLLIFGFLLANGMHVVNWQFLSQYPAGFPLGQGGGILPAITGTLTLVSGGLLIALPTGLGGAIYLAEYGRNKKVLAAIRFAIECLAAIPAIIYGLFGYAFLVVFMSLKVSLLAGIITLGLMMFPIILVGSQEAIQAVEWSYRESALSLGVTRAYVIRRIILKKAWPGVLAATVLTAGHAMGTAAPVLFTASTVFTHSGLGLDAPVMTLATHLYYLVSQGTSFDHSYGTALVLVTVLIAVNSLALLIKKLSSRY